jgi:hypothetical protein
MKKQRRKPTRPNRLRPAIPGSPTLNQQVKHESRTPRAAGVQPRTRLPVLGLNAITAVLRRLTRLAGFGRIT